MLNEIQKNLRAPKGQMNHFGKYKYRSCEDILEAVKPLLGDCSLTLSDEIVEIGDNIYVKATAKLSGERVLDKRIQPYSFETTAYAREPKEKKGMDPSQITGAASSYARKYALNGLFCIDDTKDADTMDNSKPETKLPQPKNEDGEVDPGAFVLTFGKFKGQTLSQCDGIELRNWAQWMIKNGKVTGAAKEALSAIKIHLTDKLEH